MIYYLDIFTWVNDNTNRFPNIHNCLRSYLVKLFRESKKYLDERRSKAIKYVGDSDEDEKEEKCSPISDKGMRTKQKYPMQKRNMLMSNCPCQRSKGILLCVNKSIRCCWTIIIFVTPKHHFMLNYTISLPMCTERINIA